MNRFSAIPSILLTLMLQSCASNPNKTAAWVTHANPDALAHQVAYLNRLLLPPLGALRQQVDTVYGQPIIKHHEFLAANLVGTPRELPPGTYNASYPLLGTVSHTNPQVVLEATFLNEKLKDAAFKHTWVGFQMYVIPGQSKTSQLEQERSYYKRRCEDLLLIYRVYGQRISQIGWLNAKDQ